MSLAADVVLDDLDRDALTEIVNIGVSRAAASLRKMVGAQVLLSVPSVDIITEKTAAAMIGEREVDQLVAVRQTFVGPFSGRALLIFPHAKSLELVRAVMGDLPPDAMAEMETEVLAETGNIILNGCLASMANMMQRSLAMAIPEVIRGSGEELFADGRRAADGHDPVVMFLYIDFAVRDRDIRGYIAMLMDLPSLAALRQLIRDFIARVMADDTGVAT